MSAISNCMWRQTSLFTRVYHLSACRQTLASFSTSIHRLENSSTTHSEENKSGGSRSFDSVPVHLSSTGKLVMVLGGLHKRISDVPDSIPNRVYQKTKDRFRARCVVASLFGTGLLGLVAAMRGKSAQKEGKRYSDNVYKMHRGESRLHDQIEAVHKHRSASERYSPPIDEVNK